jgi:hypothetical protein
MATLKFSAMRRPDASNPSLIDNFPIVIVLFDFAPTVLIDEVYNNAFSSLVCHICRV